MHLLEQFVFVGTKSLILRDLLEHGYGFVGTKNPGSAFSYAFSLWQVICWNGLYLFRQFAFVQTENFIFASATKFRVNWLQV